MARRYALGQTLTGQSPYQLAYCHSVWKCKRVQALMTPAVKALIGKYELADATLRRRAGTGQPT